MTAPGTTADDTAALREECERLDAALCPDRMRPLRCFVLYGRWLACFHECGPIEGRGSTESAALLALRDALETACDAALERLAKARGRVVVDAATHGSWAEAGAVLDAALAGNRDGALYGDTHGHPGCHGCQICWGNDPAIAAMMDDPDFGAPPVDAASAERIAGLEGLLGEALPFVRALADGDETYGAFHGGDPREFCPDPEVCTEDELRAHRDACDAWNRGERPEPSPERRVGGVCDGAHAIGAAFGLGSYAMGDAEALAVVTRIEAALAAKGK